MAGGTLSFRHRRHPWIFVLAAICFFLRFCFLIFFIKLVSQIEKNYLMANSTFIVSEHEWFRQLARVKTASPWLAVMCQQFLLVYIVCVYLWLCSQCDFLLFFPFVLRCNSSEFSGNKSTYLLILLLNGSCIGHSSMMNSSPCTH